MISFFGKDAATANELPQSPLCACKKVCSVGQAADCVSANPPPLDGRYDYKEPKFVARLKAATALLRSDV